MRDCKRRLGFKVKIEVMTFYSQMAISLKFYIQMAISLKFYIQIAKIIFWAGSKAT